MSKSQFESAELQGAGQNEAFTGRRSGTKKSQEVKKEGWLRQSHFPSGDTRGPSGRLFCADQDILGGRV